MFVNSDHAGDHLTRRSRTGFLSIWIWPQSCGIQRSKQLSRPAYSALSLSQWNKSWKLCEGVSVSGPSYIYGDNMSVIHNTQWPKSTLKKKSNSVCYHAVRESVAMGESLTGHISTHDNPADICTKLIPGGMKRPSRWSGALQYLWSFLICSTHVGYRRL
jgi:hypothetical protein